MKRLFPKVVLITALAGLSNLAMAQPLSLKTHLAEPQNFGVTSTLIEGEKDVILVNAQFSRSEALRVVADILDSGKNLKTIFISFGDPDYYFGLQTLKTYFPQVEVIATPQTVKHIAATQELKLKYWAPKFGRNAPTETYLPTAYTAKHLTLDGQDIEIKGQDERTFLWIPSIKAVVGGNLVSSGIHVWTADTPQPKDRQQVIASLNEIKALHPEQVIPAHMQENAPTGIAAVDFTVSYLKQYEKAVSASQNSQQLIDRMKNQYPQFKDTSSLELGAKVVKSEIAWP
ncbi:MBL fold metallo-hydrolase [Acinetobacter puyangensis]|uniref:MBL fold metallo-hydrolase n=1 Tax=Acinetobacter puyangensis TaxID=1096779 RepID=UPI003A4E22DD